MNSKTTGRLVLESGDVFCGWIFGAVKQSAGEVVFNTSMTGYQEIISDPSYAGQVVVMTAPHIGNTGINDEDDESKTPVCRGVVVRELSLRTSNWRSQTDLATYAKNMASAG